MKTITKLLLSLTLCAALLIPASADAREGLPEAAAENLAVYEQLCERDAKGNVTASQDDRRAAAMLCYKLRNIGYDARVLDVVTHDGEAHRFLVQCWVLMPNNTWKDMLFDPCHGVYYHFGLMEILQRPLKGNSMVKQAGLSEGEGRRAEGEGNPMPKDTLSPQPLAHSPILGRDFWQDVASVTVHNTIPQEAKLKRLTGFGVTVNGKPITGVDLQALTDGISGTTRLFTASNKLEIILDFSALPEPVGVVTLNHGSREEALRSFACSYYDEYDKKYIPIKSHDGTRTYYEIFLNNTKPQKVKITGLVKLKEKASVRIADIGAWASGN